MEERRKNTKSTQWYVSILSVLIVASYAYIFTSLIGKINDNSSRITNIESKNNEIFVQLGEINTNLKWLIAEVKK